MAAAITTRVPRESASRDVSVRVTALLWRSRSLVCLAALALVTACKGLGDITAPRPVDTPVAVVEFGNAPTTLAEGGTLALVATARDDENNPVTGRTVYWSSSDETVATVSNVGLVTAVRAGSVQIAVSVDGRSATLQLTVTARAVATVQVTPTAPTVLRGASVQLLASTLDDFGNILTGRPVFWGTSDPQVAVVDVTGLVTGIAPGVATVTATSETRTAAVGITVAPVPVATVQLSTTRDSIIVGQSTQLAATPRDAAGAPLDNLVTFSSSATTVATISSSGLVLGLSPGTTVITASAGGQSSNATILVLPRPVGAVIVSPAQSALTVGQTATLSVQITDANGNLLTGRPVSFQSSNVNVAQVSVAGVITATAPGTATITITSEGKIGTATVTVAPSPIASLRLAPTTASLRVGGTVRLTATPLDADGNAIGQRVITWTSGAPSVATVSTDGVVTAIGSGTALIFATAEGRMAAATVIVAPDAPSTVSVAPVLATVIIGRSQDLVATLRDGEGRLITGRTITWSSSTPSVAIVSSTGRVRAVSPGETRIDATVDGVVGSSTITVIPVPIANITVNLAAASLIVGQTTQATAVARDAEGTVLTGRLVSWASTDPAVATVSTTGLVTALSLGATSIRATSETITGSATFSVVVGTPTTMSANSTLTQTAPAGTVVTVPPSVRVTDAGGTPVAGVNVTFAVTGGGGAVVPATVATNASGIATLTSWTLGAVAGANTITAAVSGLTGSPVTFSASGTVGTAANIVATTVVTQTATAGTAVAAPPAVRVTDAFNNPVAGVAVAFAVTAGGGTINAASVTTDAAGLAALTTWTLGTVAGPNTVTATVAGLTGSPVSFNATGTVGAAANLVALSVTAQSATVGTAVGAVPSVRVQDAVGNGVSGVTVTFTLTAGGGTIAPVSPAIVVTNAPGVATHTSWTLGSTAGANTVSAAATGLTGSPIVFTATAIAGSPTTIASNSVVTQSATAGSAVTTPPSVRVTDVNGNPVAGVIVNFAAATGGGVVTPTTVATSATGIATLTSWTLGAVAGTNTATATVAGLTGSPVTFTATGVAGVAARVGITTQPAGAVNGAAFTTQPVVQIQDVNGNRTTSTAAVTVSLASGTGVLGGTLTVNAVNGVATFTNLQLTGSGAHTLSFASAGLVSATSASVSIAAGAATQLTITTQPAGAVSGVNFTTQPVIAIRDVSGNQTTSTASVTAALASGTGVLSGTTTVSAVNGVATFTNLRIAGSGPHTLTFTSAGLTSATSVVVTVTQTPASVGMQVQPAGAVNGAPFTTQPVVRILDNAGLLIATSTAAVTASVATGTGILGGTLTVNAVNGVATFTNLQLTGSGAHTLSFASAGLVSATSASLSIAAGAATQLTVTTQPAGAVSGVNFTTQPVIAIRDVSGNQTASTASVTAALASGTGVLSGTTTVSAVNGVATFTNLRIAGSGPHTLTFTSAGLTSATSGSVTVTQTPATVGMLTQPAGAVNATPFTTQPVVRILDNAGLLIATSTAAVTASVASGTGVLGGTLTVNAVNGVATFTNLQLTGSGAHTLSFASAGLVSATSASISITAGAPTQLTITTQPAGAVSGAPFTTQPVIAIRDAGGNQTTSTGAVSVAIASGTGVLSGTTTVNAVNGVATFANLQLTGSGAHTLVFSSSGLTSATSASISITAGTATQLTISTQPAGAVSGVNFTTQPVIAIRDVSGNQTTSTASVTAALASGTGVLSGTTTVSAVNGVATFTNLRIGGSGPHTLTFTSAGLTSATSGSLTVTQTPASVGIQTQPAGAVNATPFTTQPVVRILDNAGLLIATSTASVTASVATGTGVLGGTLTVAAVNGVATFTNLQLTGSGAHTLSFASAGLTSATSASITVGAGAPTQLAITTQPAGAVSGVNFTTQPVVAIRDAGNNATTSTASVTAAIASGTGTLSGTTTVAAVNGVATFTNLQIAGVGAHTLTFTSAGLTSATSGSVTVTQTPASVGMQVQPAGAVNATAFTTQPVVRIRDNAGLLIATSTAAVTASVATGTGVLGGTLTVNAVNGVATFTNLQLTGSGAHTLSFASAGLTSATSASVSITAGTATQLTISTQPAGAVSGVNFTTQPVIAIRDVSGNQTTSTASVTAAIASGTGTLSGTTTVAAVNGVATFTNLQITGGGAHTLTFTSAGLTAATSTSFTIGAGAPTQLAMTTQPAGAVSGVNFTTQPVVAIRDAGNNATTSTAAVTAAIASGTGTLSGTTTVNAVNGVATFTNLQIAGVGAHTLTFTSAGLTSATSGSVTVTQTPASVGMQVQPAGAVNATAFTTQPVVRIRDNAGLLIATSTAAVTASVATGTGVLGGTLTVNAVNGVATFTNLQLTGSGAHTLSFASAGLTSATSASVSITAGTATQLTINTQPAGAVSGVNFTTQPVVAIRDVSGNQTTSTASVTAALASGTGTLSGTTTVAAVNGVATFTDLRIAGSGAHTLTFTSAGLTSATSGSVTVTQTPASVGMQVQPAGAVNATAFTTQPVVRILDNAGLLIATSTAAVTASVATGTGVLGGTLTVNAVNGVATFTNLQLTGSGAHTLSFASAGLTSATSASVSITAGTATQLAISTQPAGAVSGVNFTTQPVIAIRDVSGNQTTSTASVTAAIASGSGTLSGTTTVVAVNGVATFTNLQIAGSGAHTLTFTATGLTSATSGSFTVTQVAASLLVQTQPSGAASGVAFTTQPVVHILDNAGLLVTTGSGASLIVTAAIATGTGSLGGTLTANASNGVATFASLAITGSGDHTLQFTTTAPALTTTSATVNVPALDLSDGERVAVRPAERQQIEQQQIEREYAERDPTERVRSPYPIPRSGNQAQPLRSERRR